MPNNVEELVREVVDECIDIFFKKIKINKKLITDSNIMMSVAIHCGCNFSSNIIAKIYSKLSPDDLKAKQLILSEFLNRFDTFFEQCVNHYTDKKNA